MDIAAIMDAIADVAKTAAQIDRTYAWPMESVTAPALVVGYPTALDFDVTFQRGSDRAVFPAYYLVGFATERTARDRLSAVISDAPDIKDALDGTLNDTVQTARVTNCKVEQITVAGALYLSATFEIEVYS